MPLPGQSTGKIWLVGLALPLISSIACWAAQVRPELTPTMGSNQKAAMGISLPSPIPSNEADGLGSISDPNEPAPNPIRLTEGECCLYPTWSQDSQTIVVLDGKVDEGTVRFRRIPIDGREAEIFTVPAGNYTADWSLVAYPEENITWIESLVEGRRWQVPNGGRGIVFSPSSRMIAWEISASGITNLDRQRRSIWIANLDGSHAREVVSVVGGTFVGWVDAERAILVTGRLDFEGEAGIWRVSLNDGEATLLKAVDRPRGLSLSSRGGWLVFTVAFDEDEAQNGLWAIRTDGSMARELGAYGAYRWRREGVLLTIPLELDGAGPALWQVDPQLGHARQLTFPLQTPIEIANNDWQISPDGQWMVYLSAADRRLWLLRLPEG